MSSLEHLNPAVMSASLIATNIELSPNPNVNLQIVVEASENALLLTRFHAGFAYSALFMFPVVKRE